MANIPFSEGVQVFCNYDGKHFAVEVDPSESEALTLQRVEKALGGTSLRGRRVAFFTSGNWGCGYENFWTDNKETNLYTIQHCNRMLFPGVRVVINCLFGEEKKEIKFDGTASVGYFKKIFLERELSIPSDGTKKFSRCNIISNTQSSSVEVTDETLLMDIANLASTIFHFA